MLKNYIPWSLRGVNPFLSKNGDKILFSKINKTKPFVTNPEASTCIHSAVPHRYLYAYLVAIKSLLRYHNDFAVTVHDDGSLTDYDKNIIKKHLLGVTIVDRRVADKEFSTKIKDSLLQKVRASYTSYLKLFDSSFFNKSQRIIILDTDTLFLKQPDHVIQWSISGGKPWFHMAPKGKMKVQKEKVVTNYNQLQDVHIQTLIRRDIEVINNQLNKNYFLTQGFCSGFVGYDKDMISYDELFNLFELLVKRFGDKIFLWGAEQTIHGLILCSKGAEALPLDQYFVFTQSNSEIAEKATFVHFVGENRFYKLIYPKLAKQVIEELLG